MDKKLLIVVLSLVVIVLLSVFLYRELAPEDNLAAQSCGIVAYDWNKPVPKNLSGFPRLQEDNIPHNNDWTTPVNYAEGTLHYRAQIKKQPEPQNMKLQVCFWQSRPGGSSFANENCGTLKEVAGTSGNVVTWSTQVQNMWKKDGIIIDWKRPRYWVGVAIKNKDGQPVSNFSGWEWNGENPDKWYPLDMRFTTVVVPKGGEFCGWDYYLDGSFTTPPPTSTINPSVSVTPSGSSIPDPSPTPTQPTATGTLTPIPTNTGAPVGSSTPSATTPQGNICGKADTDGNGVFTIGDFSEFARAYGSGKNTCADKDVDYGPCGGRDVNRDGVLNIFDFGGPGVGFAQRYYPKASCAL